jgi:VWFA-related protein
MAAISLAGSALPMCGAQQQDASGAAVIAEDVNLVVLHATVRDHQGAFISGLTANNFKVFENGQPQKIAVFSHEDVPVAAGLIIDASGSMGPKRPAVVAGALEFAKKSNPGDQMFVLDFNEHVYAGLPGGETFTANPADLERAIQAAPPAGMTALYDAITAGYERLAQAKRDKKVLIVISDGGDNASHVSLKQVLARAERSSVIVYAIGIFDEDDTQSNPRILKLIARATGGEAWFPKNVSEVTALCAKIAEDIRNQYTLGYIPSDSAMDGTWRAIAVTATGPRGTKLRVRTRAGYVAPGPEGSATTSKADTK